MAAYDCTRPRRRALAIIRHNFLSDSTRLLRYSRPCLRARSWNGPGGAMSAAPMARGRHHSTAGMRAVRRRAGALGALASLVAAGFCGIADAQPAAPGEPLRVTRITPAGQNVPAPRQIVIQFDRAVVPLGRMDRRADELPVEIEPALDCA